MTAALLLALLLALQGNAARAPARAAPPTAAPQLPPTDWPYRFVGEDYPSPALRNEEQGTVRYRVEIGADGRVSRCSITSSSGSSHLDTATCRAVSRWARFAPARDSRGNPVPDAREAEVSWRLPDD